MAVDEQSAAAGSAGAGSGEQTIAEFLAGVRERAARVERLADSWRPDEWTDDGGDDEESGWTAPAG